MDKIHELKDRLYIYTYIYISSLSPSLNTNTHVGRQTQSLYEMQLTSLKNFKCTNWWDRSGRNSFCEVGGNITNSWPKCWFIFKWPQPHLWPRHIFDFGHSCFSPDSVMTHLRSSSSIYNFGKATPSTKAERSSAGKTMSPLYSRDHLS